MESGMRGKTMVAMLFSLMFAAAASAQHADIVGAGAPSHTAAHCFDASDASDIRLWPGAAPGATGDDPCRDIPFMKRYAPVGGQGTDRAAILIIPGGGYDRLSDAKEQAPVAEYFASHLHAVAFVLYYRLVQRDGLYRYPVPMWDGRRALDWIAHDARAQGIDASRIGVFGFSAGGHLASTLALHPASNFDMPAHDAIDAAPARFAFLGLGYPVISMLPDEYASPGSLRHLLHGYDAATLQTLEYALSGQHHVSGALPPVFLFESMDDQRISPQNSVSFAAALRANRVPADVHLFEHGEHGSGLAEGIADEDQWPALFQAWLARIGFADHASLPR
jgi:acetyl esterase/lipase